ncbi:hypothetical protein D3C76_1173570 [compost metagenome]
MGLHVHAAFVQVGFDEHRCQAGGGCLLGVDNLQADGLALGRAQLQCRYFHSAALAGQQGDDPAGGGLGVAIEGIEAVDLARATHFEKGLQGCEVRLAELGHVLGLQGQFDGFSGVEPRAVDAGDQLCCLQWQGDRQAE